MNRPISLTDQTSVIYAAENCVLASVESPTSLIQIVSTIDNLGEPKSLEQPNDKEKVQEDSDHTDAFRAELNDSLLHKDVGKLVPGQKVNLKVFVMSVEEQNNKIDDIGSNENNQEKFCEIHDNTPSSLRSTKVEELGVDVSLKIPQRKISRFLVSPVLSGKLNVPKDKDFGGDSTPQIPDTDLLPLGTQAEVVATQMVSSQPTLIEPVVNNAVDSITAVAAATASPISVQQPSSATAPMTNVTAPINIPSTQVSATHVSAEPLRKISAPLESTRENLELDRMDQKVSVCSLKEEVTKEEQGQVCGPELINTLEQLKISLDNLKHSSHPKKDTSEGEPKKVSSNVDSTKSTTVQVPQTSSQILSSVNSPQPGQNIQSSQSIPQQQTLPQTSVPNQQVVPQQLIQPTQPSTVSSPQVIAQPVSQIQNNAMPQTQTILPQSSQIQPQQTVQQVQQNLIQTQPVLPQSQIGLTSNQQVLGQHQQGMPQGQHVLTQGQIMSQGMQQSQQSMTQVHNLPQQLQQNQQSVNQSQQVLTQIQQGLPQSQVIHQTQQILPPQPVQSLQQSVPQSQQSQQSLIQSQQMLVQQQTSLSQQQPVLTQPQPVFAQPPPGLQPQNLPTAQNQQVPSQSHLIITSQPLPNNAAPAIVPASIPTSMPQNFVPISMPQYNSPVVASQSINIRSSASIPQQIVASVQPNLTTVTTQAIHPPISQALPPCTLASQDIGALVGH